MGFARPPLQPLYNLENLKTRGFFEFYNKLFCSSNLSSDMLRTLASTLTKVLKQVISLSVFCGLYLTVSWLMHKTWRAHV